MARDVVEEMKSRDDEIATCDHEGDVEAGGRQRVLSSRPFGGQLAIHVAHPSSSHVVAAAVLHDRGHKYFG